MTGMLRGVRAGLVGRAGRWRSRAMRARATSLPAAARARRAHSQSPAQAFTRRRRSSSGSAHACSLAFCSGQARSQVRQIDDRTGAPQPGQDFRRRGFQTRPHRAQARRCLSCQLSRRCRGRRSWRRGGTGGIGLGKRGILTGVRSLGDRGTIASRRYSWGRGQLRRPLPQTPTLVYDSLRGYRYVYRSAREKVRTWGGFGRRCWSWCLAAAVEGQGGRGQRPARSASHLRGRCPRNPREQH